MLETGQVVTAICGRDKGSFFLVMGCEKGRILIADGRRRKLEHPKRKNPKHLAQTKFVIAPGAVTGNRRLRKLLSGYNQGEAATQQAGE